MSKLIVYSLLIVFAFSASAYAQSSNTEKVCLSPKQTYEQCLSLARQNINNANKSIWIEGGSFFANEFINALIQAKKRGVTIYKVDNERQINMKYIAKKDFQLSGQLALENISAFTPNINTVLIDNKTLLITTFSNISPLQKTANSHVLLLENKNLVKQYQNNWREKTKSIALQKLENVKSKGSHQFVIPRSPNGNYYIYGKLNNIEVRFLIDTGASYSVVPEFVAKHLKLTVGRPVIVNTAAGKRKVFYSKVNNVQIGSIHIKSLPVLINPYAKSGTILLGMNFLRRLDFFIHKGNLYLIQRSRL